MVKSEAAKVAMVCSPDLVHAGGELSEAKRKRFAERLQSKALVSAPGVFDMISARIADRLGFDCLYMTGYGVVASHLGLPDAGLATYSDMVSRVTQIASLTQSPLAADADTGYGGLLNVQHTVRGYEAAGAVAVQLEDQEFPKKVPGRPKTVILEVHVVHARPESSARRV